ncbi:MAG: hypothetical protein NTV11_17025 [Rhodocyclales bacterium]|nr:hypothetical protein [Rhodocyclales bacterium]
MPKRHYALALACYLAIPAAMIAGVGLFNLIDPEMARSHADYVRDYRLLELARRGVLIAVAGLAVILWAATCHLVIKARQRSPGWLVLAAAGPLGFSFIAMLKDRSPAPGDAYQRFIGTLKIYWRVALEIAVFVSVWFLAYESVVLKRELMIRYESFTTGTPVATIIDRQNASSGMWAFSEGLAVLYLVVLIYLLWPIVFNLAGRLLGPRTTPTHPDPRNSGD